MDACSGAPTNPFDRTRAAMAKILADFTRAHPQSGLDPSDLDPSEGSDVISMRPPPGWTTDVLMGGPPKS